jgi:hypothetical protein
MEDIIKTAESKLDKYQMVTFEDLSKKTSGFFIRYTYIPRHDVPRFVCAHLRKKHTDTFSHILLRFCVARSIDGSGIESYVLFNNLDEVKQCIRTNMAQAGSRWSIVDYECIDSITADDWFKFTQGTAPACASMLM